MLGFYYTVHISASEMTYIVSSGALNCTPVAYVRRGFCALVFVLDNILFLLFKRIKKKWLTDWLEWLVEHSWWVEEIIVYRRFAGRRVTKRVVVEQLFWVVDYNPCRRLRHIPAATSTTTADQIRDPAPRSARFAPRDPPTCSGQSRRRRRRRRRLSPQWHYASATFPAVLVV